ncbi:MAG: hypothetical protein MR630_06675 [Selenomonas sp.]|uniref:hypothetical protein n=1 Tax=Selenomonas sp. TaxID=2053611 RepID=UPI0025F26575|nr:hypothetical protein [Selenomonas sp.]MCI6232278.1 hypothetical protein [Selenomonas sp.]
MNLQIRSLDLLYRLSAETLTDEQLGGYRYQHLLELKNLAGQMPDGGALYAAFRQRLFRKVAHHLTSLHRKIVVGILCGYSSEWIGDELYWLLEHSNVFEPYVFALRSRTKPAEEQENQKEYDAFVQDIQRRGLRLVENFNTKEQREYTWQELPVHPDICIWLSPWMYLFQGDLRIWNFPLTTLHTYIPYGYFVVTNAQKTFYYDQFNQELHNLAWLIFQETAISLKLSEKYCFSGSRNCRYTGYPKMDDYFVPREKESSLWDSLLSENGTPHAKKIIYSPHHTLATDDVITLSTFASNGKLMLQLARKYSKETVWVFKPHPQLGLKAIRAGLFKSETEWEAYLDAWKSLPNATVQLSGGYHRLFRESDAIINDSGSFLAEYLFVNKPMLELRRPEQAFNAFGEKILEEALYQADGKDAAGIERFIQDVVLKGNDSKASNRKALFAKYLDYYHSSKHTAAENIFGTIYAQLSMDGGII